MGIDIFHQCLSLTCYLIGKSTEVNEARTILDEYVGVTLRQVEMIATINSRTSSSLA
jgi:hypothetical protein